MNHHTQIEHFARRLIEEVRDESIRDCDRRVDGTQKGPVALRWKEAFSGSPEDLLRVAIPDIVDTTIATLLRGIDQELFPISTTAADGTTIQLSRDGFGELCGWFMGEWRFRFSRERTVDDFADLREQTSETQSASDENA